jgi:hypothetical protein
MHIVLTVPGAGLCRNDYISAGVSGFQACSRQLSDLQREDKASASMEQINRLQQDAIALKAKGREVHCRILRLLVSRTKKKSSECESFAARYGNGEDEAPSKRGRTRNNEPNRSAPGNVSIGADVHCASAFESGMHLTRQCYCMWRALLGTALDRGQ